MQPSKADLLVQGMQFWIPAPTLTQSKKNSLSLSLESAPKYDLIWVDGAHGYPTVAIDIANSLRLLNSRGILACDDVWTTTDEDDSMYKSIATNQTLEALRHAKQIKFELILKRLGSDFSATTVRRKYIALVMLDSDP